MKRAVLEAWGKLRDDMEKPEVWAKAYRRLTGYTVAEVRVEPMRRDLLADVDNFVRSIE